MKNLFALIAIAGIIFATAPTMVFALEDGYQEEMLEEVASDSLTQEAVEADSLAVDSSSVAVEEEIVEEVIEAPVSEEPTEEPTKEVLNMYQKVKRYFIEGGPLFMSFVLICLIFGLALCIERIIYLNMATTNTKRLVENIETSLNNAGVDAAKDFCRNTPGPVASIFYQGLDRSDGSYQEVAKAIEDYGSVEMSKLERGLSWISLFIALAPMLGFMGTVIGMIDAFDDIAEANTINASIVAKGIKIALITTVSGLVVAIILQIFYNYILSKIDSIVLDMEEASMDLVDLLYKHKIQGK